MSDLSGYVAGDQLAAAASAAQEAELTAGRLRDIEGAAAAIVDPRARARIEAEAVQLRATAAALEPVAAHAQHIGTEAVGLIRKLESETNAIRADRGRSSVQQGYDAALIGDEIHDAAVKLREAAEAGPLRQAITRAEGLRAEALRVEATQRHEMQMMLLAGRDEADRAAVVLDLLTAGDVELAEAVTSAPALVKRGIPGHLVAMAEELLLNARWPTRAEDETAAAVAANVLDQLETIEEQLRREARDRVDLFEREAGRVAPDYVQRWREDVEGRRSKRQEAKRGTAVPRDLADRVARARAALGLGEAS